MEPLKNFFFDEYQALDLRDRRLDERARKIFVQLQNKLGSCIRRVFVDPNDARQAYDFFSNPKVTGSKLIEPHFGIIDLKIFDFDEFDTTNQQPRSKLTRYVSERIDHRAQQAAGNTTLEELKNPGFLGSFKLSACRRP